MPSVYAGLHHPRHWPITGGRRGTASMAGAVMIHDHVGAESGDLMGPANAAAVALLADPNYCRSVGVAGSPVNVAVHAFKVAWNASAEGQGNQLAYNGQYDDACAAALLGLTQSGPPSCQGGVALASSSGPGQPHYTPGATTSPSAAVATQNVPAPTSTPVGPVPAKHPPPAPLHASMFGGSWWMWAIAAVAATVLGYVGVKRGWFEMGHYAHGGHE